MVEIQPETDAPGHVVPHVGVAHHGLFARCVVLLDADLGADVLLGDPELLLHTEFDGQAVGVPTGFAVYELALLRLVAAEDILDGTRHHVVDTGQAVGTGRALVENKGFGTLAQLKALAEGVLGLPLLQYLIGDPG